MPLAIRSGSAAVIRVLDALVLAALLTSLVFIGWRVTASRRGDTDGAIARDLASSIRFVDTLSGRFAGEAQTRQLPIGRDAPLLLFLFDTGCIGCQATRATWVRLAHQTSARVLAVTLENADSASRFLAVPKVRVWQVASEDFVRAFHVRGVPVTIVVGGGGLVRYAKAGVLSPQNSDTVLAVLQRLTSR